MNRSVLTDRPVVEALPKVWRTLQVLLCARFKSALIVPKVVTGFVPPRESVALGVARVTDVTVPVFVV